jgi:hypothetical protein
MRHEHHRDHKLLGPRCWLKLKTHADHPLAASRLIAICSWAGGAWASRRKSRTSLLSTLLKIRPLTSRGNSQVIFIIPNNAQTETRTRSGGEGRTGLAADEAHQSVDGKSSVPINHFDRHRLSKEKSELWPDSGSDSLSGLAASDCDRLPRGVSVALEYAWQGHEAQGNSATVSDHLRLRRSAFCPRCAHSD